jgi:hypothetical protein
MRHPADLIILYDQQKVIANRRARDRAIKRDCGRPHFICVLCALTKAKISVELSSRLLEHEYAPRLTR